MLEPLSDEPSSNSSRSSAAGADLGQHESRTTGRPNEQLLNDKGGLSGETHIAAKEQDVQQVVLVPEQHGLPSRGGELKPQRKKGLSTQLEPFWRRIKDVYGPP